jgi:hypothetical protein
MQLVKSSIVIGVIILVLCVLTWGTGMRGWKRAAMWGAILVAVAVGASNLGMTILKRIHSPPEWDFMCFWTWGRMAATGLDFYDPLIGPGFGVGRSADFWNEILNVGFWYPPQTMLMLAPLGYFTPRTALALWYAFNFACTLAAAHVLWQQFAKEKGVLGLFAISALVLCFPGTQSTFGYAQTHAVGLLLSALVWQDCQRARAGLWAALSLIVKPYLVVWFAFLVVIRNWRAVGVGLLAALAVCCLAGVIFGFEKFVTYLLHNPMERTPLYIYSEGVNQSLIAVFLRATHQETAAKATWVRAIVGLLSFAVVIPSALLVLRMRKHTRLHLLAGAILLMVTLIVYPFALTHYSMMLLPVLMLLWSLRDQLMIGSLGTVVGILALVLGSAIDGGALTFWVHLALLFGLLAIGSHQVGRELPLATAAGPEMAGGRCNGRGTVQGK